MIARSGQNIIGQADASGNLMTERLYPPESIEVDSPMTMDGYFRSKRLKLLADQESIQVAK